MVRVMIAARSAACTSSNATSRAALSTAVRARASREKRGNPRVVLTVGSVAITRAVAEIAGRRVYALARLSAAPVVEGRTGSLVASRMEETRQATSLRERGLDQRMRDATGGIRHSRGLRTTIDPRKGTTKGNSQLTSPLLNEPIKINTPE